MSETTASTKPTLFNLIGLGIDLALSGAMFLFFYFLVIPEHVPFYEPLWKTLFTAYTSLVMAGFWFMFFTLFRATIVEQLRRQEIKVAWVDTFAKLLHYK